MDVPVSQSKNRINLLLLISLFITQLDSGIMSTNLSSISRTFALSPQEKSWVVAVYTLGLLFATPIMGSFIDRFGYRTVFLMELGFYFIGVVGIATSSSFTALLVARIIQSFGSSSILTLALSRVFMIHTHKVSGKVGNVGALVALATIVAPIISVVSLAKTQDWRAIYLVLAAMIFLIFLMAWVMIPKEILSSTETFDVKGNTLFVLALVAFNLLLSRLFISGNLVELLAYGILFCLTIGSFLVIEARREANQEKVVFSRKLWTIAKYRMSLIGGIVTGLSMSLFAFFPSMIEATFQLNARKAGSFMTIMAIGTLIGSKLAGYWTGEKSAYHATRDSMIAVIISLIILYFSVASLPLFLMALFLFGIAIGMIMTVPLQVLIVEASPQDRNTSLSLLSVSKKLGMTIGITLMSIFAHFTQATGVHSMILVLMVLTIAFVWTIRHKE